LPVLVEDIHLPCGLRFQLASDIADQADEHGHGFFVGCVSGNAPISPALEKRSWVKLKRGGSFKTRRGALQSFLWSCRGQADGALESG